MTMLIVSSKTLVLQSMLLFAFRIKYTKSCCAELDPASRCNEVAVMHNTRFMQSAETDLGRLRGVGNANRLVP